MPKTLTHKQVTKLFGFMPGLMVRFSMVEYHRYVENVYFFRFLRYPGHLLARYVVDVASGKFTTSRFGHVVLELEFIFIFDITYGLNIGDYLNDNQ